MMEGRTDRQRNSEKKKDRVGTQRQAGSFFEGIRATCFVINSSFSGFHLKNLTLGFRSVLYCC